MKNLNFFNLSKLNSYKLIKDVFVRPLKANRDSRGMLVETLKTDWQDICGKKYPFAQNYYSITKPNIARDEDQWHLHPSKQVDRFVVVQGKIVAALYDHRQKSETANLLNLFLMGELEHDRGLYSLLIPANVLHCFLVVSPKPAIILNYPTSLYDQTEEKRVDFNKVKLADNSIFSWNKIRKQFNLPVK